MQLLENYGKELGAGLILALLAWFYFGTSPYPEVGKSTYEFANAFYSACNQRDPQRVETLAKQVVAFEQQGSMTAEEVDLAGELLALAQGGDWESATREARKLLQAQVVYP